MSTPTLGARINFTHFLRRAHKPSSPRGRREWSPCPNSLPGLPVAVIRPGIVIGVRTLANGEVDYGWEDNPTVFYAKEHFTAYLVAYDVHRKPVYVLPEHCTPELSRGES